MKGTNQERAAFFARLKVVIDPLRDDCHALKATTGCTQRHRRVYVRALFAEIEASIDMFAQYVLMTGRDQLEPGERMLLEEREVQLGEHGEVKTRPAKINLKSRIRFVLNMLDKHSDVEVSPDYTNVGWRAVQDSIKVRDRMAHPKIAQSLEISDDEIKTLELANKWFDDLTLVQKPSDDE